MYTTMFRCLNGDLEGQSSVAGQGLSLAMGAVKTSQDFDQDSMSCQEQTEEERENELQRHLSLLNQHVIHTDTLDLQAHSSKDIETVLLDLLMYDNIHLQDGTLHLLYIHFSPREQLMECVSSVQLLVDDELVVRR